MTKNSTERVNRFGWDKNQGFPSVTRPDQCLACVHWSPVSGEWPACTAFEEVPIEILKGEFDHRKPFPSDRGIRFTPKPVESEIGTTSNR
jgi:hypothetical protein